MKDVLPPPRDHRPDCLQGDITLVVTREHMPLGYEIFPGNRVDVSTVAEIFGSMEARFGEPTLFME